MAKRTYGSGEYSPTPSHQLPAFKGGAPRGYVCPLDGHIVLELDPVFADLCPICLREWAFASGVSRLIPMGEAIEREKALEKTVKVVKRPSSEVTTQRMNLATKSSQRGSAVRVTRDDSALQG